MNIQSKLFSLILILSFFTSCNKNIDRSVVISVTDISFSELTIKADYILGEKDELFGGICWDTVTGPTINSNGNSGINNISETRTTTINSLIFDTPYFIRGYIILKSGEIIYSTETEVRTMDAPQAPCEIVNQTVSFGGANAVLSHFQRVEFSDGYHIRTSNGWGYEVNIKFWGDSAPETGVYKTASSGNGYMYGLIPTSFLNCNYIIAADQDLYVTNFGNNQVVISFCDLTLSSNSEYCGDNSTTISGEIRNFN
jgi:hypothetical protein